MPAANDLQSLFGVGPSIARDLVDLGVDSVAALRERRSDELYAALCELRGEPVDRCVLYVFRSAVYQARTDRPDPGLVPWWKWMDDGPALAGRPREPM